MRPAADVHGFSLIELLVALAIVALIAAGLLNLAGESTRTAAHLETRVIAAIVADNLAADALLADAGTLTRPSTGTERVAGRDWRWQRRATPAGEAGMLRIDIDVTDQDGQVAGQAWVFR